VSKSKTFKVLAGIISLFLLGLLYLNSDNFIRKQEWKHRNGGSIGDWIEFDDTFYAVKGRTIYKKHIAKGKVIFCVGKMLIVKEIATGETGYYINKTTFKFL